MPIVATLFSQAQQPLGEPKLCLTVEERAPTWATQKIEISKIAARFEHILF